MKRIFILLFLALSFTFCSQVKETENSLLWEISGNGLERPSYLYGTIHVTCDASLNKSILNAMDETEVLVLELDFDDPELNSVMEAHLKMKDHKTLKSYTTDEEYQLIETFIEKNTDHSLREIDSLKPFMILASILPRLLDCPIESFELALMRVAYEQEEEILGLETAEEQLKIFDDIPYEAQVKDLLRSARDNLKQDRENLENLLAAYRLENIERLYDIMLSDSSSFIPDYKDVLLDNRNKNWIPKIISQAKIQPTFFGVGAGHLPGKNGVINLLRAQGFTVKAVY